MKRRDEVIVGVFVTVALIVGVFGTLWLARRGLSKSYPMYARFDWGNNLKVGQQVLLAGVQIGFVDQVELNPAGYLDVTMSIDKGRQIPANATAVVQNEGFFGDKSIALHPCGDTPPPVDREAPAIAGSASEAGEPHCHPTSFLPPGDTIPTGRPAPTIDMILTRVDSMSGALDDVVQSVRISLVQKGGIDDLRQTIASTNELAQELTRVAAEQSKGLSLTLASLRRTANALDSASIDSTVQNMQRTTENLAALTNSLKSTTTRLDNVMAKIETGDGTMGRLINDPGVYNELRQSLARLDSLIADVKANPKRYINVKVF
ncbi:MAG TPA: MlaD family protein [Gemmatimonadaceae bacterium]|nr:MlaD family protein [Gemmatimonadaceae bacterium]